MTGTNRIAWPSLSAQEKDLARSWSLTTNTFLMPQPTA